MSATPERLAEGGNQSPDMRGNLWCENGDDKHDCQQNERPEHEGEEAKP